MGHLSAVHLGPGAPTCYVRPLLRSKRGARATYGSVPPGRARTYILKGYILKGVDGRSYFCSSTPTRRLCLVGLVITMSLDLVYNPIHQVVVCRRCQTCLVPCQSSVERHLRGEPHRLLGPALKAHLAYIDALTLRDLETLKRDRPREPITPIKHLPVHAGFRCLLCPLEDPFYTIRLPRIRDHIPSHDKRSTREHKSTPL